MSQPKYRPGRIQSLDASQEIALKQLWAYLLEYWGYGSGLDVEELAFPERFVASSSAQLHRSVTTNSMASSATAPVKKKGLFSKKPLEAATTKKRDDILRKVQAASDVYEPPTISDKTRAVYCGYHKHNFTDDNASVTSFVTAYLTFSAMTLEPTLVDYDSKISVEPRKNILPCLSKYSPRDLHRSFLAGTRHELYDNYLLRFVRARKLHVENALTMISRSLHWRAEEYPVDEWFLEGDAQAYVDGLAPGLIKNLTTEKSAIIGYDYLGGPVFLFQARKHFAHDSPLEETQRFILMLVEWMRLFMDDTQARDTGLVMFDLTGFSLKNTDNPPIKFLAEMFEAHYPETLGLVIVHNAPWIFSTIWNIIKNWLDPVVASKIHFTKTIDDVKGFVDGKYLPKEIGGSGEVDVSYPVPTIEHTHPPLQQDSTYRALRRERDELNMLFFDVTRKWVQSTLPEVSAQYLADKIDISTRLSENYKHLDPYERCPGVYDRKKADGLLSK